MSAGVMLQGSRSTARLRFRESRGDLNIFEVPGTDYELHLKGSVAVAPGKVVRGEIHASALRMHRSDAGGRFIEPVYGPPRIVQGTVVAVDRAANRVLLDFTVPAWVTIHAGNSIDDFHEGEMWNCYVESGTGFAQA